MFCKNKNDNNNLSIRLRKERHMTPIHINSEEAERNFAGLLGSVYNTHIPVIIEQKDLPMGVLISPEQFEQYEAFRKSEKERFWHVVKSNTRSSEGRGS